VVLQTSKSDSLLDFEVLKNKICFFPWFSVGKFFGGHWEEIHACLDGHKFVCLDDLYLDVKNKKCLVYSFGISDDWSFEEHMVGMGCTVRTFDPTIDGERLPKNELMTFKKIGLAHKTYVDKGLGRVS